MPDLRCSFCGKRRDQVNKLIAGGARPGGVFICDECVRLCNEIVEEEVLPRTPPARKPGWRDRIAGWPWHLARRMAEL